MERPQSDLITGGESHLNTYLSLQMLIIPYDQLVEYKPPDEVVAICADPDPREFKNHDDSDIEFYSYLDRTNKSTDDLSWGERYLLSRGYIPDTLSSAGKRVLARLSAEILELKKEESREDTGIHVQSGVIVGKIIELESIPGSLSGQKLAYVDVGVLTDGDGKPYSDLDGHELRDIRQIVCGGTDVLLPGHQVLVALPGARLEGGKKVRSRHLNIPNEEGEVIRYNTDGVLLSYEEASPAFKDFRDYLKDQVLILPRIPQWPDGNVLYPGQPMDDVRITARRNGIRYPKDLTFHRVMEESYVARYTERFWSFVFSDVIESSTAEERQEARRQIDARDELAISSLEEALVANADRIKTLPAEASEALARIVADARAKRARLSNRQ